MKVMKKTAAMKAMKVMKTKVVAKAMKVMKTKTATKALKVMQKKATLKVMKKKAAPNAMKPIMKVMKKKAATKAMKVMEKKAAMKATKVMKVMKKKAGDARRGQEKGSHEGHEGPEDEAVCNQHGEAGQDAPVISAHEIKTLCDSLRSIRNVLSNSRTDLFFSGLSVAQAFVFSGTLAATPRVCWPWFWSPCLFPPSFSLALSSFRLPSLPLAVFFCLSSGKP